MCSVLKLLCLLFYGIKCVQILCVLFSPQTDPLKHSGYYVTPVFKISWWWNSEMSAMSSGSNLPCWRASYVFIIRVLMSEPSEPWWCTQELITETSVDCSHLTLSAYKDFTLYFTHTCTVFLLHIIFK